MMNQCFYLRDYIILFWLLLCLMRSRLFQEFNKKSNSLYTILRSSKLAGSQRAPFLRQFLLRLNYNSFFEVDPLFICFLPFSINRGMRACFFFWNHSLPATSAHTYLVMSMSLHWRYWQLCGISIHALEEFVGCFWGSIERRHASCPGTLLPFLWFWSWDIAWWYSPV